ncbi:diguanylate cyclase [Vibrio sp. JC009]|uniref:sensor domain-containing diguanylate cyclase n=1 Tax=Vibrio sp. JC009 TaxID=2912314 RepID=UPI0023AEFB79|nr:diguanylate cyclase [Vibrio sp. JC009]WED24822.1 diguanylate cyclase [Vibrio sp. JC009]
MSEITLDLKEFHWSLQVMNTIDVGLVVLDKEYKVCLWNDFMQSYSGINADKVMQKNLFEVVDNLPKEWLKAKIDTCTDLRNRVFSNWETTAHIFDFKNYSPLSQGLEAMYQNMVITPLTSLNGEVSHVCLMIQDVSDVAKSRLHLRASNQKLATLSRTDGLTGLFNRAYWESCLVTEFEKIRLTHSPSSLVIFDIDHFKKVNDTYGHGAGDEVIRKTAQELRKTARTSDICGRYGGEEFTVLLPETTADQAHYFAERLRKRIENLCVETEEGNISYTISLGICEFNSKLETHLEWLEKADQALYQSKNSGRNQSNVMTL